MSNAQVSPAIIAFLAAKGIAPTMSAGREAALAKALGYEPPAVRLETYTPKSGKRGLGLYLVGGLPGCKGMFDRVCDGEALTPEGRAAIVTFAKAVLALVE